MANDITTTRSNVFQVTDIDKFKKKSWTKSIPAKMKLKR